MYVYTGHNIFEYVYVCTESGPDKGRLMGISKGCGPWRLPDHQQPLGFDAHLYIAERMPHLKTVEIDGNGIDGSGVFHGTPVKKVSEIDWTDLLGPSPVLYNKHAAIKPKVFGEMKYKTKHRFVSELTLLVQELLRRSISRTSAEDVTWKISGLIDEFFKEDRV